MALAIDPDNSDALFVKGLTFYNIGNATGAREFLDKVLEIQPDNFYVSSLRIRLDNRTEETIP